MALSNQMGERSLSTPGRQVLEKELRQLLVDRRHWKGLRTKAIQDAAEADRLLRQCWPRFLALCADLGLTTCQAEEHLRAFEARGKTMEEADFTVDAPEGELCSPVLGLTVEAMR